MKYIILLVVVLGIGLSSQSCNNDEPIDFYDLIVANQTPFNIAIYTKADLDGTLWTYRGVVDVAGTSTYSNYQVGINYKIRAAREGQQFDDYFFESNFINTDPTIPSILVGVTP